MPGRGLRNFHRELQRFPPWPCWAKKLFLKPPLVTFYFLFSVQVEKSSDDIQNQFKGFLTDAKEQFVFVEKRIAEVEELRVSLAKYFVEDTAKFKLEDCFQTIANFSNQVTYMRNRKESVKKERALHVAS